MKLHTLFLGSYLQHYKEQMYVQIIKKRTWSMAQCFSMRNVMTYLLDNATYGKKKQGPPLHSTELLLEDQLERQQPEICKTWTANSYERSVRLYYKKKTN